MVRLNAPDSLKTALVSLSILAAAGCGAKGETAAPAAGPAVPAGEVPRRYPASARPAGDTGPQAGQQTGRHCPGRARHFSQAQVHRACLDGGTMSRARYRR